MKNTTGFLLTIFVGLYIGLVGTGVAAQTDSPYLTDWPNTHKPFLPIIRSRPQQVIDRVSLPDNTRDPLALASWHALLSRAYSALVLPEKALSQANRGLMLVTEAEQPWLYYQLSVAKAEALDGTGEAREGKALTGPAIDWAQSHEAYNLLAYALSIDGYLSLTLSATDEALAQFQRGYKLAQQRQTRLAPGDFASMIALVYEYRGEPESALPYYEEARTYYANNQILLDLANTLYGLGKTNIDLGNRTLGLEQLRESARMAIDIGDLQGAAYSYLLMAKELIKDEKLSQAESFLTDALTIFEDAANRYMQINALLLLENIATQRGNNAERLPLLSRASALAQGDAFLPSQISINQRTAEVLASQGRFNEAYTLLQDNVTLREKLIKEQNSQRLLELKTRFEVEQQQIQNALLKEQNLRQQTQLQSEQTLQRYVFAVIFLLIVICLLLTFLYINGKRHRDRLEKLANVDELTGLMTRRKTLEQVDQHLLLSQRHDTPFSMALLDLDNFKAINDEFGHVWGDDVLRAFGELARNSFRATDLLGRVGGEEFMFCFPHTALDDAEELLQRFASQVKDIPHSLNHPEREVSVSAGVAIAGSHNVTAAMALADEALYKAKEAGRDCIKRAAE